MAASPAEWWPLCGAIFALGLRHGLDPDHLVAIDGLTRFNSQPRPQLARWCGSLFSAGHGVVVILIAVSLGDAATRYTIPGWLQGIGAWFSIGSLICLGLLNLMSVLRAAAHELARPVGLRSRLLARLTQTAHPLAIAGIGALFALSVDTISEAALFSVTAARFGGWGGAAVLGILFTAGMLMVDGANGAWVAALLRRGDRRARTMSRVIGLTIATLSLAVAALGVVDLVGGGADAGRGWWSLCVGIALVVCVAVGSLIVRPPRVTKLITDHQSGSLADRRNQVDGRA
jgi:high-affinity nickel-transport protein